MSLTNRLALATIIFTGLTTACGPVRVPGSELSLSACRDGLDNDGDGRIDCADPDCRAVPCVDADAGNAAVDAMSPDGAGDLCTPACLTGERCRNQMCEIALPADLEIIVLSMNGPGGTGGILPRCADARITAECGVFALKLVCTGCPPDPYVRVDLERPRTGGGAPVVTPLGRTRSKIDTESASWVDIDRWETDPNPVHVETDDTLRLVALDFDDVEEDPPDDLLFGCSVRAADLRVGPQSCISKPSGFAQSDKQEFDIWIDVRVR